MEKKAGGDNMKKIFVFVCCLTIILSGCMWDPYSEKRPFDYGNATWTCEEYDIWFCVDTEKEDYYCPEGELKLEEHTYFCKFYFINQTNQLSIAVYPYSFASISDNYRDRNEIIAEISGECKFSEKAFTLYLNTEQDTIFNETVKQLTFRKTE